MAPFTRNYYINDGVDWAEKSFRGKLASKRKERKRKLFAYKLLYFIKVFIGGLFAAFDNLFDLIKFKPIHAD